MLEKSFGKKKKEVKYSDRVGAYAIIFCENEKIAVVKTKTGYFLPGGGVENKESDEECIIRECLEEAGLAVKVEDFICKGELYRWSEILNYYMHSIGNFYFVRLIGKVSEPIEDNHELVWLDIEEAYKKLLLEHQVWAVREGVELIKNMSIN